MADHYCEFTTHFPVDQDDKWVRCGKPAPLKLGGWYCAEHFDLIERAMVVVRETLKETQ